MGARSVGRTHGLQYSRETGNGVSGAPKPASMQQYGILLHPEAMVTVLTLTAEVQREAASRPRVEGLRGHGNPSIYINP